MVAAYPTWGLGTTSACAENTTGSAFEGEQVGNYLRVRGEYTPTPMPVCCHGELPPRARRIHENRHGALKPGGTTSACAENTIGSTHHRYPLRNYLRVRGEYNCTMPDQIPEQELPPRARRIRHA